MLRRHRKPAEPPGSAQGVSDEVRVRHTLYGPLSGRGDDVKLMLLDRNEWIDWRCIEFIFPANPVRRYSRRVRMVL